MESFSPKIRNKAMMLTSAISIQHGIGSSPYSNQTRKKNKRHPNWKGGTKIICSQVTCSYLKKTLKITHTHKLELLNKFTKVTEYKINMKKSVVFLYTNKIAEKKIKKTTAFKVPSSRIIRNKFYHGSKGLVH